jgi:hypothetical protein
MSEDTDEQDEGGGKLRLTRRTFLWLGGATALGALAAGRLGCYSSDKEWGGHVLWRWEAHVLAAVAAALIPDAPGELSARGPSAMEVAHNVDAYLLGMPKDMVQEIHGMFALLEHGTLLGGRLARFTRLSPEARLDVLLGLRDRGGMLGQAFEGVRALCYLGWYQDDRAWPAIGYDGPLVDRPAPPAVPTPEHAGSYGRLVAEPGAQPRGVL